jgi:transposase
VAKGKSKKLALIAVANKLMKQAFGIAKSGLIYDPEFRRMKPKLN